MELRCPRCGSTKLLLNEYLAGGIWEYICEECEARVLVLPDGEPVLEEEVIA